MKRLASYLGALGGAFAAAMVLAATALVPAAPAEAAAPEDWGTGFQPAASPTMEQLTGFHDLLLVIITGIVIVVLGLLLYVIWRFGRQRNPEPSRTSHNTVIEVIWTVVPIIILVVIAIPSFKLLYFQDSIPETDMTIKTIGRQWYWSYEYPDHGGFQFDSFMIPDERIDTSKGQLRQLSTDAAMVIPAKTNIRIIVTASDVLHSFAMPAFGIKTDAVPGRLNETWVRVEEPGTYYGQCSEICGVGHSEMPIEVRVLPKAEFDAWVEQRQAELLDIRPETGEVDVAKNESE